MGHRLMENQIEETIKDETETLGVGCSDRIPKMENQIAKKA